jgi:hypothetical protein
MILDFHLAASISCETVMENSQNDSVGRARFHEDRRTFFALSWNQGAMMSFL